MKKKINSLYIHIPFCKSICPYCDFFKVLKNEDFENKYIEELIKDIHIIKKNFLRFKTIYIGGGTPSALSIGNLEKLLMETTGMHLKNYEFTIECNPEDITIDKLKLFKKYGINRISLGVQSFNTSTLNSLNRNYNINYQELIKLIKLYIDNISLDFIYGLPNETLKDIDNNLERFLSLDVNHISLYSLTVNKNTYFYNQGIKEISQDLSREYYDLICKKLKKANYIHYEVSNFAKKGFESKHNLNYWYDQNYIGVGVGASGYINDTRYTVFKILTEYLKGERKIFQEKIDIKIHKEEFIMLGLRLKSGINLNDYKKIFNQDFLIEYKDLIRKLTKEKLINICNNRLKCTYDGMVIQDKIIIDFFDYITK